MQLLLSSKRMPKRHQKVAELILSSDWSTTFFVRQKVAYAKRTAKSHGTCIQLKYRKKSIHSNSGIKNECSFDFLLLTRSNNVAERDDLICTFAQSVLRFLNVTIDNSPKVKKSVRILPKLFSSIHMNSKRGLAASSRI